ncbi:MAG: 23S rRNA (guanosine(2251)-2'-O)-methyltransferase RlmB [Firmicutes bacterium]|nr:23S rRNA (guanosine(2251)-2'-O)-methyltransferase RlmB [Bacillota bacterium]
MADLIIGRNACTEALRSGRKIRGLLLQKRSGKEASRGKGNPGGARSGPKGQSAEGALAKIAAMAEEQGIPVEYRDRQELDRLAEGAAHQGVIAMAEEYSYSSVEEILAFARKKEEPPLLVILDGLEDPHNLGAILRTAECAGVHGVIIPKNRSVRVNQTVWKTSAGAAQHVRCAQVTNLSRLIGQLQEEGIWVCACDMDGGTCWETDLTGPLAIVIGSEGRGISRLVREHCDLAVSIPLHGQVNSLNASNAAAVIIYEALRQRTEGGSHG